MSQNEPGDFIDESRHIWDTNAEAWDERIGSGNGFQTVLIEPTVDRMLDIQPGERVLDIACGNGIYSRKLAAKGAYVVASDFSPKLIEYARSRTTENADRISYHVADATDEAQLLALAGEAGQPFDAAVCNMALMDMPAIEPLFRAVAKLLRPGGRFVFSIMHPIFNGLDISLVAELPGYDSQPVYSVKVGKYLSWQVSKGLAIKTQPLQQFYWHRPMHELLNAAFESGLVMDRLEEPPSPPDARPGGAFDRANYDVPPVLFVRLRPQK